MVAFAGGGGSQPCRAHIIELEAEGRRVSLVGGAHTLTGACSAGLGLQLGLGRPGQQLSEGTCHLVIGRCGQGTWRHTRGNCQNPWPRAVFDRQRRRQARKDVLHCLPCYWLSVTSQSGSQLARQPYRAGGTQPANLKPLPQSKTQDRPKTSLFCRTLQAGHALVSPLQK